MRITSLRLSQVRGYEQAEFQFQPGMNLIVGVNGVGKSTVLDALRIMLIRALPRLTGIKMRSKDFTASDIANDRGALTVELQLELAEHQLSHLLVYQRKGFVDTMQEGIVREQVIVQKERDELSYLDTSGSLRPVGAPSDLPAQIKTRKDPPLAVYFSTRRSLYSEATGSQRGRSAGGPTFAFADSLRSRGLRIREFTNWWLAQEALGSPERLDALKQAVLRFLDDCTNVHAVRDGDHATLMLDKRGTTLVVSQLSDGERGMLTLVLDLARRLALANPKLSDPLRDGQAVVLIDELDLHLHPRWQRTVVQKLLDTFPACQFIATTHSPFVIQSLRAGQLINVGPLDDNVEMTADVVLKEEYADKSVEDIAETVMGIEMPQKSERYQEMMAAAEEYFRLLREAPTATPEKKERLKRRLDELSKPFSDDAAYIALLNVERETILGKDSYAPD